MALGNIGFGRHCVRAWLFLGMLVAGLSIGGFFCVLLCAG